MNKGEDEKLTATLCRVHGPVKSGGQEEVEVIPAEQLRLVKGRADAMERARNAAWADSEDFKERLTALAKDFDRRYEEAKAEAEQASSKNVAAHEIGISLAWSAAAGELRRLAEQEKS